MVDETVTEKDGTPIEALIGAPTILNPVNEQPYPGFVIAARTDEPRSEWNLEIHDSRGMLGKFNKKTGEGTVRFHVPPTLIPPGSGFYYRVEYFNRPFWSKWAWSGNKEMGLLPPNIQSAGGPINTNKPVILLSGYPGAKIRLYEAGSGAIVHGEGEVGTNGEVWITVVVPLPSGRFPMTANQTVNGFTSGWMRTKDYIVP